MKNLPMLNSVQMSIFTLECGYDRENTVSQLQISRLTKETVLYKIDRQITGEGLLMIPVGELYEPAADRMVINIDPNKRLRSYSKLFCNKYRGYKPYINELYSALINFVHNPESGT